jgi:multiple sugar transport system permease protein
MNLQKAIQLPKRRKKAGVLARRETLEFYLFISPWIIGLLVFLVYPLVSSLYLSFTRYSIATTPVWIGLDNYISSFKDPHFLNSLWVTIRFAVISIPGVTVVALGLALLLSQKLKGIKFFRTIYFMPSVMPAVAISLTWFYVLRPESGPLAGLLSLVGVEMPRLLSEKVLALPTLIMINIWLSFGGQMVIYLAGIKGIPADLYEVAEIDGAGRWARFLNVTLPMLSPTIFLNLVLGIIGAMQMFDVPYVMTQGGPGESTLTYMFYLYNTGWIETRMGLASALGWILFFIIMAITLLVLRSSDAWVYYEGERK